MAVMRGYGRRYGWDRRHTGQLKPENALNRAAQLMQVGRAVEANQTLYDIITESQPRSRRQWTKTLESIMLQLMEYSVDLRKANMVKEALHKYRALCVATNVQSLEDVVRTLVKAAEAKTEAARKDIDDAFAHSVVDDLEDGGTEAPETLLLEAAGAEQSRERSDRQMVVPWMKFLWEVYRVVLDIVKSHIKLETCYHDIAALAFRFCLKYQRFMEFRRLCDMLRQHMQALIKSPTQRNPNDVLLLNPETTQRFLDTRFIQLQTAVELRHWQEAYRTVEDIHTLISIAKKAPRPQTMAVYYDNLMQVFWVSDNFLYHAHALYRLYNLSVKQNKNLSAEDAQMMASRLVLASLAIPVHEGGASAASAGGGTGASADIYGSATEMALGEHAARHQRMAALLGYSTPARRPTLLAELKSKQVLDACHDELQGLYEILEGEMAPLQLSKRLAPVFEFIAKHDSLKEYAFPLRKVAIHRLLEQLGRVYDVMRMEDVERLVEFADIAEVELVALEALKTRSLGVRFDHQKQCLRFESALFATSTMRQQLGAMSRQLAVAMKMVKSSDAATLEDSSSSDPAYLRRAGAIQVAKDFAEQDQEGILARKFIIEERRIETERKHMEAEKEAKRLAAIERARREAEEEVRRKRDKERREQDRTRREMEEREKADLLRLKREIEKKAGAEPKPEGESDVEESVEGLDREELLTKQREEQIKSRREQEKKVVALARRMDYMDRAMREKEWPLLIELQRKEAAEKVRRAEEARVRAIEEARRKHAADLLVQEQIKVFEAPVMRYTEELLIRVEEDFENWVSNERALMVEAERQMREKEERRREEERIMEEERLRAEQEAAEEERRRLEEEAERERLEAEAKAETERKERELREQEEKQSQREREIEAKLGGQRSYASTVGGANRASGAVADGARTSDQRAYVARPGPWSARSSSAARPEAGEPDSQAVRPTPGWGGGGPGPRTSMGRPGLFGPDRRDGARDGPPGRTRADGAGPGPAGSAGGPPPQRKRFINSKKQATTQNN